MSEIKVGDEVWVRVLKKGKVTKIESNGFCYIKNKKNIYYELIKDAIKIEKEPKPFIITPQDVGRFARTKSNKKAFIGYIDKDGMCVGVIIGEDTNHWGANGEDTANLEEDDLVAWWDE